MAERSSHTVEYVHIFTEPQDSWGGKGPQEAIWSNPTFPSHRKTVAQDHVQMTFEIETTKSGFYQVVKTGATS